MSNQVSGAQAVFGRFVFMHEWRKSGGLTTKMRWKSTVRIFVFVPDYYWERMENESARRGDYGIGKERDFG